MAVGDIGVAQPLDSLMLASGYSQPEVAGFLRVTDSLVIVLWSVLSDLHRGVWVSTASVDGAGNLAWLYQERLETALYADGNFEYGKKGSNNICLVDDDLYAVTYTWQDRQEDFEDHRQYVRTFTVDPITGEIDTVMGGATVNSIYWENTEEPPERLIAGADGILLCGIDHTSGAKQVVTLSTVYLKFDSDRYNYIVSWQIDIDGSIGPEYSRGNVIGYEVAWSEYYSTHIVFSGRYRTHLRFQNFGQTNTIMIEYREYDQPGDVSLYHGVRMFSIGADGALASGVTDFAELFVGYDWTGQGGYADSVWGVLQQIAPNHYIFYDDGYVHSMLIYELGVVTYLGSVQAYGPNGPTNFVYIGNEEEGGTPVYAAYNRIAGHTSIITFNVADEGTDVNIGDTFQPIFNDDEPPFYIHYQRSGIILSEDTDNGGTFVSHGVATGSMSIQYWEELLGIITAIKHRWNPGEFTMEILCGGVEDSWVYEPMTPIDTVSSVINPRVWKPDTPGPTSPIAPVWKAATPGPTSPIPQVFKPGAPGPVSLVDPVIPAWIEQIKVDKSYMVPLDAPSGILENRKRELERMFNYKARRK